MLLSFNTNFIHHHHHCVIVWLQRWRLSLKSTEKTKTNEYRAVNKNFHGKWDFLLFPFYVNPPLNSKLDPTNAPTTCEVKSIDIDIDNLFFSFDFECLVLTMLAKKKIVISLELISSEEETFSKSSAVSEFSLRKLMRRKDFLVSHMISPLFSRFHGLSSFTHRKPFGSYFRKLNFSCEIICACRNVKHVRELERYENENV